MTTNAEKCEFGRSQLDFLGHSISTAGITPLPDRIAALAAHPRPTNTKELQNFLGVLNFYRKFLPNAACTLRPLNDALRGSPQPREAVQWTAAMGAAFEATKAALLVATLLAYPKRQAQLALMVDASAEFVGAALQ